MKQLPNLLTLGNLFSGCIAIAFILHAQPFLADFQGMEYWVTGTEQAYWGSLFILLAAVFDMLDGAVARALDIHSPIGADLDSLADIVSFGVAPSMILFKMLWAAYMTDPRAMDVPMLAMTPAFVIACFGAVRLARYNVNPPDPSGSFQGLPIPAVGILVASFPLINWFNPLQLGLALQKTWVIYLVIALLSWLMVSSIPFFKFLPQRWTLSSIWRQLLILVLAGISIPWLNFAAIPFGFVLYVLISLLFPKIDNPS